MRFRLIPPPVLAGVVSVFLSACGHGVPAMPTALSGTTSALVNASFQYQAEPLPSGFIPAAIMKSGAVPGSYGKHAAIFSGGKLTILKDDPSCAKALKSGGYVTAMSSNVHGDIVGVCNYGTNPYGNGLALYYHNGLEAQLKYPKGEGTFSVLSISINDSGVVVASVYNNAGDETSGLAVLYPDGKDGRMLRVDSSIDSPDNPLSNDGKIADTQYSPGACCVATIAGIYNWSKTITQVPCSVSNWINDDDTVVGFAGCSVEKAFVYSDGVTRFIPSPAVAATGVNDFNDVIGEEKAGIFLYSGGIFTPISSKITPAAKYTLIFNGGYFLGLSNGGSFVASVGHGKYFFVRKVPDGTQSSAEDRAMPATN